MDVEKIIAEITAAGIELADRRRSEADDGWTLRFSNGAMITVSDDGKAKASGQGADDVARLIGLAGS